MPTKMDDIQRFVDKVVELFHPQKVILFGSYAYGNPTPNSDVDLLVVLPFEEHAIKMSGKINRSVRQNGVDRDFALDLLCRTPEQIAERIQKNDDFILEITQHGKVLYDATE